MRISAFFQQVLGARLQLFRRSWGALQKGTNRVFLRVWDDEIDRKRNPNEVLVFNEEWGKNSFGRKERLQHLAMLRAGASGIAVVCFAAKRKISGKRRIAGFDPEIALQLGRIAVRGTRHFARIDARISVRDVAPIRKLDEQLGEDIEKLRRAGAKNKVLEALIKLRIGQGQFREDVLKLWGRRCCVTQSTTLKAIRASHIKSWKESTRAECRDPHNGLPLVATLDSLFDAGLISFANNGRLLISPKIGQTEMQLLNLQRRRLVRRPRKEMVKYLEWHRRKHKYK